MNQTFPCSKNTGRRNEISNGAQKVQAQKVVQSSYDGDRNLIVQKMGKTNPIC